jgi:hypothetical protein
MTAVTVVRGFAHDLKIRRFQNKKTPRKYRRLNGFRDVVVVDWLRLLFLWFVNYSGTAVKRFWYRQQFCYRQKIFSSHRNPSVMRCRFRLLWKAGSRRDGKGTQKEHAADQRSWISRLRSEFRKDDLPARSGDG